MLRNIFIILNVSIVEEHGRCTVINYDKIIKLQSINQLLTTGCYLNVYIVSPMLMTLDNLPTCKSQPSA